MLAIDVNRNIVKNITKDQLYILFRYGTVPASQRKLARPLFQLYYYVIISKNSGFYGLLKNIENLTQMIRVILIVLVLFYKTNIRIRTESMM